MPTPNRGYQYPSTSSPATVPADLQAPLEQIDADVQTLVDESASKVGLNGDGTAPPALEAQIRALISTEAPPPDLSAYSTTAEAEGMVDDKIEAALAEANLDAIGALFKVGPTPPDTPTVDGIPVVWIDTRRADEWEATPPVINLEGRTVTIPADEGAVYLLNGVEVSTGVHVVEVAGSAVTVTVRAQARAGYTLAGTAVWSGVFVPGFALLGEDSFTTGVWETGRPGPGGVGTWKPLAPNSGVSQITAQGLNFPTDFSPSRWTLKTGLTATAARFSFDYDLSQQLTANVKGQLRQMVTNNSPMYGAGFDYGPGIYLESRTWDQGAGRFQDATLTPHAFTDKEPWAVGFNAVTVPASGHLVVTYQGADASISVDGTEVATGVLAGPITMSHYALDGRGNSFIRNFKVEWA